MTDFASRRIRPDLTDEPDARALGETWEQLGDDAPAARPPADVDAAWDRLSTRLFADEADGTASPSRPRTPWLRAAAVVALLLGGGSAAWNAIPASAHAGSGERTEVVLPGGSVVALNAGSTLRWARGFAWLPGIPRGERVVRLAGEAFFDVDADGRPFRVETADARVRVLGTRFNVRSRPGEGTAVSVDEGSVEVRDAAASVPAVVLVAGQRVTTARGALEVSAVGAADAAVWREGGFAATDAALGAVVSELERRFTVRIDLSSLPPETAERRVTLYYSPPVRLERVLDDVATTLGLRYRPVAGGWEVVPSP